ncbi:MAG: HAD-IIIC family phosphatase [Desulfobaccales bacterium]
MVCTYSEMQGILNKIELSNLPELNIVILRNIMVEPLEPLLRYFAYEIGFNGKIRFGEYDNIFQETIATGSELINKEADIICVFMKLETLSWSLSRNYAGMTSEQIESEVNRIKEYISAIIAGIRKKTSAAILWHALEMPLYPALGIWDSQIPDGQLARITDLNKYIVTELRNHGNGFWVDLNLCIARLGISRFYDQRYWHMARAPYSREALFEIASEDFKFIRSLKGKNKKCLVLDCDNVLWGGIIGEDGLEGIKLGKEYPGSPYVEFQQEVVNLYNRGIIIALCSKNNEDDVWHIFNNHPDMVLKEEHIAIAKLNWNDKAANLKQISSYLNIGLDSMVFIDDSEFEVNLIREVLPEVTIIHCPSKNAVVFRDMLASCGLFDSLNFSEEDKQRGVMYKAEAGRKKLMTESTDMINYYRSLEMVLEIYVADDFSIPRIVQLTQRTNQFNLTTRRYSESDIKDFASDSDVDMVFLRLKDRFGDSGITGCCILKFVNEVAIIDTFLLSCRILGRGVEDAFLIQMLKRAKKRGSKIVVGEYCATRKNSQVEHFFEQRGFTEIPSIMSLAGKCFKYELHEEIQAEPDYFKKIISEIGKIED